MYAYERFSARPTLDIDFLGYNIHNDRISSESRDASQMESLCPENIGRYGFVVCGCNQLLAKRTGAILEWIEAWLRFAAIIVPHRFQCFQFSIV